MEGITIQEIIENSPLKLKYFNEEELEIDDFVDSMNKDLLKVISKNYGFLEKDSLVDLKIRYFNKNDGERFVYYFEDDEIDLDKGLILYDEIRELLVDKANFIYEDRNNRKRDSRFFHYQNGYDEDEESDEEDDDDYYADSMNDFIVSSIKIILYRNAYKVLHKKKFYNDLYNDLMEVAWNPIRVLDWCIDFQELRDLKNRWEID